VDSEGRTIWIVDAPRDDGKRFVVRADEKLTAFLELEAAIVSQSPLLPPGSGALDPAKLVANSLLECRLEVFHSTGSKLVRNIA
jgi:hypothetical protein